MEFINIEDILKTKEKVDIIVPKLNDNNLYKNFIVELLDMVEAYFFPIKNGISKYAVKEIVEGNYDLMTYLHEKRYFVIEDDFLRLASFLC